MSNTYDVAEQDDAKDRLMGETLPELKQDFATIRTRDDEGNETGSKVVQGWKLGDLIAYTEPNTGHLDRYNIASISTGEDVITYEDFQPFGFNLRQASRFIGWLNASPDALASLPSLRTAYAARNWIGVEKWLQERKDQAEIISEIPFDTVDEPADDSYTTSVKTEVGNPPKPIPLEVNTMSATATANGVSNAVTGEPTARKKRGRQRDPQNPSPQSRPGYVMRPACTSCENEVQDMATALQEKPALILAAAFEVFKQIPIEQQFDFIKVAKIAHAKQVQKEQAERKAAEANPTA